MAAEIIETDICIVGAGPSGVTTSLFLSKMGIAHTIVDAAVFPRDKVCGDGLDLKVMRVLNQFDPMLVKEVMSDVNFSKSWGCKIITAKNKKTNLIYKPTGNGMHYPFFMVSKRAYFDNFLTKKIDKVYADFRQGVKVKKIERQENRWKIYAEKDSALVEINSKMLVGADGDHSVVLRTVGERKINRKHYAGGVRQYWKGISDIQDDKCVELYFPKKLPLAYLWMFPLPDGEVNVGCGLVSEMLSEKSIDLKALLEELITRDPAIAHRFQHAERLDKTVGWGLPLASLQRKASGDGWLLVGDAASLICPTTGEGIGPGMMSGFIAATFIQRAVQENNFAREMFVNYDREISRRLKGDIKSYNLVRNLSPIVYNFIINTLSIAGIAEFYFKKKVVDWVKTAQKPIDVNM